MSTAAQNQLLASAFRKLNLNEFDSGYLDKVLKILSSAEDKSPAIEIGKSELRRFDSRLYLMDSPASSFDQKLRLSWTGGEPIRVAGCGDLSALNSYKGPELEISLRQSGERCKPSGRNRSQSLKKLMQEYKLEPWLRARTPIIWRNGEILALAGVFSCSPELEVPEFNWDLC